MSARIAGDEQPAIKLIASLFRAVLSAVLPPGQAHRADHVRQADYGPCQPPVTMPTTAYKPATAASITVLAPNTTTSAVAATTALSQARGRVPSELARSAVRSGYPPFS
jgi:hypothetical protein